MTNSKTTYIIVINDISEDSLFGSEDAPANYDAQELQTSILNRLQVVYPDVNVQVWDSDSKTEVQTDGGWNVEDMVMEVISQTWQTWLEQFETE